MKILFRNSTAEKQFSSKHKKKWKYPEKVKTKLLAAENYITQACSLQDIANYPPYHFHQLNGKRAGEWSIYLGNTGYRITMIPCNEDGAELLNGDIRASCSTIIFLRPS